MIKFFGISLKQETMVFPLLAFVSALLLPFTTYVAQDSRNNQDIRKEAAYFTFLIEPPVGSNVYFDPLDILLTGETPVKIMANMPSNQIVFIRTVFTFDNSKIKLTNEITPNPQFTAVVEKTDMATANSTGKAVLVIAANPADTPLTGNFEVGNFMIAPVQSLAVDQTDLSFDGADMQFVDLAGTEVVPSPANAIVRFNANVTPTGSPTNFNVFFDPNDILLTGDTQVRMMANMPSNQVVFIRAVYTFDASKVKLSSEITPNPALSSVVEKTNMATANTDGRAVLVIAASATDTPLNGNFEIGSFTIAPVQSVPATITDISYDTADMQIVDFSGTEVPLLPANAIIRFTADVSPTIDPSLTSTVTPDLTQPPGTTITPGGPTKSPNDDEDDDKDGKKNKDDDDQDGDGKKNDIDDDKDGDGVKTNDDSDDRNRNVGKKRKRGDLNNDGKVNVLDFRIWLNSLFVWW